MKSINLILLTILLTSTIWSCNSQKRQVKKATVTVNKYPQDFAKTFERLFPSKDSLGKADVKYIVSKDSTAIKLADELQLQIDFLKGQLADDEECVKYLNQLNDLELKLMAIKAAKPRVDTIRTTLTYYLTRPGLIDFYKNESLSKDKEITELKEDKAFWKLSSVILFIALLAMIYFWFRK